MLTTVVALVALLLGFIAGRYWGRHIEREVWRSAVSSNLKRWREEQLQQGEGDDCCSWMGGK